MGAVPCAMQGARLAAVLSSSWQHAMGHRQASQCALLGLLGMQPGPETHCRLACGKRVSARPFAANLRYHAEVFGMPELTKHIENQFESLRNMMGGFGKLFGGKK